MNDTNMAVMEPAQQVAPIADNPANLMVMIARAASEAFCHSRGAYQLRRATALPVPS